MPTRRVVVLSYFGVDEGDRLVQALERGLLQRDVPVCIGSYGITPRLAAQVADLPNTSYAPIFTLKRSGIWERRSLTPDEEKRLPRSSVRWAGPLPTVNALLELPTVTRLAWATELGRRYRDAIRTQVTRGVIVIVVDQDAMGFKADCRDFDLPAAVVRDLGVKRVRLLSNNPRKARALVENGERLFPAP